MNAFTTGVTHNLAASIRCIGSVARGRSSWRRSYSFEIGSVLGLRPGRCRRISLDKSSQVGFETGIILSAERVSNAGKNGITKGVTFADSIARVGNRVAK
jgi:hypothetical protein